MNLPPKDLMLYVGSDTQEDFVKVGEDYFDIFLDYGLKPRNVVLDIGCGCGRIARQFVGFSRNQYYGFDISEECIRWCQQNFPKNFYFTLDYIKSEFYRTEGVNNYELTFPYISESIDFVHGMSVFTHILKPGVERYIKEIYRVLKSGGIAITTWFLGDLIQDERKTQYPKKYVLDVFSKEKFGIYDVLEGSWKGDKEIPHYQDIVVVYK